MNKYIDRISLAIAFSLSMGMAQYAFAGQCEQSVEIDNLHVSAERSVDVSWGGLPKRHSTRHFLSMGASDGVVSIDFTWNEEVNNFYKHKSEWDAEKLYVTVSLEKPSSTSEFENGDSLLSIDIDGEEYQVVKKANSARRDIWLSEYVTEHGLALSDLVLNSISTLKTLKINYVTGFKRNRLGAISYGNQHIMKVTGADLRNSYNILEELERKMLDCLDNL